MPACCLRRADQLRGTLADRQLSRKLAEALLHERDRLLEEQPAQPEEQETRAPRKRAPDDTLEELTQRIAERERELRE